MATDREEWQVFKKRLKKGSEIMPIRIFKGTKFESTSEAAKRAKKLRMKSTCSRMESLLILFDSAKIFGDLKLMSGGCSSDLKAIWPRF